MNQTEKAKRFAELHVKGAPLLLYNAWDAGSAKSILDAGAQAIARAVQSLGGTLSQADLGAHETIVAPPVETVWNELRLATQPPVAQGVLLNMAVQGMSRLGDFPSALILLTNALPKGIAGPNVNEGGREDSPRRDRGDRDR